MRKIVMMKTLKLWLSLISTLLVFIIILHHHVFVIRIRDLTMNYMYVISRNSFEFQP